MFNFQPQDISNISRKKLIQQHKYEDFIRRDTIGDNYWLNLDVCLPDGYFCIFTYRCTCRIFIFSIQCYLYLQNKVNVFVLFVLCWNMLYNFTILRSIPDGAWISAFSKF